MDSQPHWLSTILSEPADLIAHEPTDLSPPVSDEVKKTTCFMCACRCGVDVHLRDGRIRHLEGNRDHPVNKGVLCAKGSAGMLHHESPARLRSPLKRIGPRGSGQFAEITWTEALETATDWLRETRQRDPTRLAFFTGRDQSQALTGWWAQQYGTYNYAAHGGFCSVNMAAAGIYSIGGSFWEFCQPDWDRARLIVLFGVAEDHDSNPIKAGLTRMRRRNARIISINPVRTGYSAIADSWIGITPGTDGMLILALIGELLRTKKIDVEALRMRTNAPWLIIQNRAEQTGLFARSEDSKPLVVDARDGQVKAFDSPGCRPALGRDAVLADGTELRPVFALLTEKYLADTYSPENAEKVTGVPAERIRRLALELAHAAFDESFELPIPWRDVNGRDHETSIARPVAVHAMRGISAHANGFQTCRSLHLLQMLLGAIDCPGGMRFKPPYPKPVEIHPRPGKRDQEGQTLTGMPLGYPLSPEDLLVDQKGEAMRLDKAFSWEAPLAAHGMLQSVIPNAAAQDPYAIDILFLFMANMAWNSSMNTPAALRDLTARDSDGNYRIPRIIVADAFSSETVAYADLVFPDTSYFERYDCISLLDRPIGEPNLIADAIRHPVVARRGDVRPFQDVLIDLGGRLQLPGFVDSDGAAIWDNYADYMTRREVRPGIGPLAGWRGMDGSRSGRGASNPEQLQHYVRAGGFWTEELPKEAQYFKHVNVAYQEWAIGMGLSDTPMPFYLQLWCEPLRRFQLAAEGYGDIQPPERLRQRIVENFVPLPSWTSPAVESDKDFPLHAITQRPMAMYHSWGSHNPWLRQIHSENFLYVPSHICDSMGLQDGDWVWVESRISEIRVRVRRMHAVNHKTVWTWNAIGKRGGAWQLDAAAPEVKTGFILNHLIPERNESGELANADPVTGQAAWFDLMVRLRPADSDSPAVTSPQFDEIPPLPGMESTPPTLRYGQGWCE
ncbi:MAG: molybdopterin-dependent oxidoreductase [Rhodobacteraceae bacterium]|nr:molybdopterin-dependent oxidoreductase [Paracoccaceae bacterium]MCY4198170.1 molybdopterin-dependent oxidoreductase [Paracoccaceae bacterium]